MGAELGGEGNLLLWYVCCVSGFTSCRLCLFFLLLITFFSIVFGMAIYLSFVFCCVWSCLVWERGVGGGVAASEEFGR